MYNFIKFYKDKITVYVYVDEEIDWKETNILDIGFPISDYFNHAVEFSEDLTVKDFVVLLNKYSNEIDMHFSAYNHGLEFDIYHREVLKKQQKDYFKECDEIEIIWETEVQKEEGINNIRRSMLLKENIKFITTTIIFTLLIILSHRIYLKILKWANSW